MQYEKKNIPILFILNHFYPEVGAIRTEYQLARTLGNYGDRITVVTTYPREYRMPELLCRILGDHYKRKKGLIYEKIGRILVYRIPSYVGKSDTLSSRLLEIIFSVPLLLVAGVIASLREKPDVIITGGDIESVVTLAAYPLKFFLRKRILTILHDIHSSVLVDLGLIKEGSITHKLIKFLEILLFRIADAIVVHSPSNKTFILKKYNKPSKVHVIFLWADIKKVKPIQDKEQCPFKNKFVIYYGGVLSYAQVPEVIIEAAKVIAKRGYSDILFLIVGDGPEKPKLVEKAEKERLKNIIFKSFVPWEKHVEFLRCSDIGLVTLKKNYKQPVVPSKLIEIMSAGVVPLLSIPAHNDAKKIAVDLAKAGIWVKPEDPEALADAIISLYENKELLELLKKRARKFAEEHFSLEKNAHRYRQLILRLIEK